MCQWDGGPEQADTTVGPRMHRDPDFLAEKRLLLDSTHVAPVQALVRRIGAARGTDDVPFVDPVSGGVRAASTSADWGPRSPSGSPPPTPVPRVKNGHRQLWPGIEAAFDRAAEVSADGLAAPVG